MITEIHYEMSSLSYHWLRCCHIPITIFFIIVILPYSTEDFKLHGHTYFAICHCQTGRIYKPQLVSEVLILTLQQLSVILEICCSFLKQPFYSYRRFWAILQFTELLFKEFWSLIQRLHSLSRQWCIPCAWCLQIRPNTRPLSPWTRYSNLVVVTTISAVQSWLI